MNSDFDKWNDYLVKSIIANNEFGINGISDVVELSSGYFIKDEYAKIVLLIKEGNINALRSQVETTAEDREYLHVLSFKDQMNKNYVVTVYDGDELWQNPQVIEIFSV
jgi:hypothetical protein